jgi:hypothetical protein
MDHETAVTWLTFCFSVEMFLISIVHHRVFGYKEYHIIEKEPFLRGIFRGNVGSQLSPLLQSFAHVANPRYDIETTRETILNMDTRDAVDLP